MLYGNPEKNVENLTSLFLETPFTLNTNNKYRKTGFLPYMSLSETFTNKYTSIRGEKLQVRAMKAEDIYIVTGETEMKNGYLLNLTDIKYIKLFANESDYWLATANNEIYLWNVRRGYVDGRINDELRNPPSCFSKLFDKS